MAKQVSPRISSIPPNRLAVPVLEKADITADPGNGTQEIARIEAMRQLSELQQECAQDNWDGYGAVAVTCETGNWVETLLKTLPSDIEPPSLSAEPDGMISLEWYRSPKRILSVSVSAEGNLYYAVLFDTKEEHGQFPPNTKWPGALLDWAREVLAG